MLLAKRCISDDNIILSFDDGPNPYWTEKIIDLLDQYDVKAIFFILGERAVKYPFIMRRIIKRGHMIGNHSFSHSKGDFSQCHKFIYDEFGVNMNFLRAPFFNYKLLRDEYSQLNSYTFLEGTVDTQDYLLIHSDQVINNILEKIGPGGIITMHDGSDQSHEMELRPAKTYETLSKVIPILKEKYNFVLPSQENLSLTEIIISEHT